MHIDVAKYVFVENVIFLRALVPMMAILVLVTLTGPWGPDTSRFKVVICGLGLIAIAVIMTWMGLAIIWPVKDVADTNPAAHDFKTRIEMTLFVIPFVSASIGSDLISHAVTSQLTFTDAKSTWRVIGDILVSAFKVVFSILKVTVGLFIYTFLGLRYLFMKTIQVAKRFPAWLRQNVLHRRAKAKVR